MRGDIYKYRFSGSHEDVTIVVLFDPIRSEHIPFCLEIGVRVGDSALLTAKRVGKLSKKELCQIEKKYFQKKLR